jgi:hypothetical protein
MRRISRIPTGCSSLGPRSLTRPRHLHVQVGPPDPLSNMRPVLYKNEHLSTEKSSHPYSLDEFHPVNDLSLASESRKLDALNHQYWSSVCRIVSLRSPTHNEFTE